jgi:arylsulfatase A-like enzyme
MTMGRKMQSGEWPFAGVVCRCSRLLLLWVFLFATDARSQERPNIVVIFSDDQRADALGAHGNPYIQTPHLDDLANRGFSFRQAYVMGSHHGAVCAPSRAMLMTGRNLFRVYDNLDTLETFPQRLNDVGYATFGTGKWHQSRESFAKSFAYAENVFFGGMNDHFETSMSDRLDDGSFTEPVQKGFSSSHFADAAIRFIEEQQSGRQQGPFLVYLALTAPHDPRTPPSGFTDIYSPGGVPLPANYMPVHPFDLGPMSMTVRDEHLAPWPRPADMVRAQIADYYGLITHMDFEIGRVLEALRRTGAWDNTVVVFAADNGLALGSHGLMGKQSLYEHSTRVPLIVAGPGIPHGESEALTYLYDLAPTLLDLAGADDLPRMDGRSLSSVWQGERLAVRETLFTAYHDTQRAVRDGRWKLIRYPRLHLTQLFDLRLDPFELRDVSDDPAHGDRIARMMDLLEDWQRQSGDPHPLAADSVQSATFHFEQIERRADRWQPEYVLEKYFGGE